MEQARPDSTLLPAAQMEGEHVYDRDVRAARIARILIEAPTETQPLDGEIIGGRPYRSSGRDLSFIADEWLRDARALGMIFVKGPDGNPYRVYPTNDGDERAAARDAHWFKLNDQPHRLRAVIAAIERGFEPEEPSHNPVADAASEIYAIATQEREAAARLALADVGLTSEVSEEVCTAIEDHRDVLAATQISKSEDDETFDRHAAMQIEAENAVAHAPVRSLADLRAKLTYLIPIIAPDVASESVVDHLKAIQADMDRLCRERSRPADNHEDATLLRLGEQLDRAHAHWRVAEQGNREPSDRLAAAIDVARAKPGGPRDGDLKAAWDLPGVEKAHEAAEDAFTALEPICEAIWNIAASTPAGLAVKARAALVHTWTRGDFEDGRDLGNGEDLPYMAIRRLIEACCTLAGVDWRGDPIAPPMPDPVYAAIDRHLTARVACLGLDDGHDKKAFEAAHDRRRAALGNVEKTRPTTVAGLLALARHVRHYLGEDGAPPVEDGSAQDHALVAMINACSGLHERRYPGMDRDWAEFAAYHLGFLPVPQHKPAGLLQLELAIPMEAKRLLALAEAEFERRRQAYVGFHDPSVWPRVAAGLRRDMRMDALALVVADLDAAPHPDAALLALRPGIVALITAADRAQRDHGEAESAVMAAAGPSPEPPGFVFAYPDDRVYRAAVSSWEAACQERTARQERAERDTDYAARDAAAKRAESALIDACLELAEIRATTLDGLILKARFAERGNWDDLSRGIVDDLLAMGTASLRPVVDPVAATPAPVPPAMPEHDLSAMALNDLAHLHMMASTVWTTTSMYLNAPFAWDLARKNYSPLGDIIEGEVDRLFGLATAAAEEARRRQPLDDGDRDRRLEIATQHAMLGGGSIDDKALVAELAAAWGA